MKKPTQQIFLWGMMGAGKTFTGKALAQHLGWNFVDLDACIEQQAQVKIEAIFAAPAGVFRILETQALKSLLHQPKMVLSLGGGTPCFEPNLSLLLAARAKGGLNVFVNPPFGVLYERVLADWRRNPNARPLLAAAKSSEELRAILYDLYLRRYPIYAQADREWDNSLSLNTYLKF
jgi:shikimate kinase